MATCFAPRTTMQRSAIEASTSRSASLESAFRAPLPAALRRSAGRTSSSRPSCTVPLAFRGQDYWGGRNFQRRGNWGPFVWQLGNPASQATLEDLAREFGFNINSQCGPENAQQARKAWSDFVNQGSFPVDFEERDGQYLLTADVPGLQKADLKITVNKDERSLSVSGERQRAQEETAEPNQKRRQCYERRMGKFQRTFKSLPEDADFAGVSARVDKGVLTITVRKLPEVQQPDNTININID